MPIEREKNKVPSEGIAVVIPVYNHGKTAPQVVSEVLRHGYPVFVVDDGSTDDGPNRLRRIPGIHLFRHDGNQGKGQALLTGFAAAGRVARWAITLDADGQHNPRDIATLVQAVPAEGRAIILGRREGMRGPNVPWTSRFGRQFSNFWVWASGGAWLSDSQSGFRVYPITETLSLGVRSRRFQFEVEVLARAGWKGMPVVEVPVGVNYKQAGERVSHFRPFVDFWRNSRVFTRLILTRMLLPKQKRRGRWNG